MEELAGDDSEESCLLAVFDVSCRSTPKGAETGSRVARDLVLSNHALCSTEVSIVSVWLSGFMNYITMALFQERAAKFRCDQTEPRKWRRREE